MSSTRVKFGDVVINVNETLRDESEHSFSRVVGLEHIDSGDSELRRWDELSSLPEGTSFKRIFRRGHVLFGKRRAYQRKVAVASFDGICSSDILVFTPSDKRLNPGFLLYIVQSEGFFAHALQTSSGSLSPRTRWQDLASFEFELPSLDEQERILELLSAVDAHAEALRNQANVAEDSRRVVLHDLLTTAGEDWTETTLGLLVSLRTGKLDVNAGVEDGEFPFFTCSRDTYKIDVAAFSGKSVIVAGNGDLNVKYCEGEFNAYQRTYILQAIDESVLNPIFLFHFMDKYLEILRNDTQGSTIQYLKKAQFTEAPISLPPLVEQKRIVDEISKIDALIQETNSALLATQQLRAALLNKEIS